MEKEYTDMLYWVFSTIPQTIGAMLGVFAMLVLYRLQYAQSVIDNWENEMRYHYHSIFPERYIQISYSEILNKVNKANPDKFDRNKHLQKDKEAINALYLSIQTAWNTQVDMKNDLKIFAILSICLILFSVVFLCLVPTFIIAIPVYIYILFAMFVFLFLSVLYFSYKLFSDLT